MYEALFIYWEKSRINMVKDFIDGTWFNGVCLPVNDCT